MKPQIVRLLDVFFIGPVMAYGGWKLREYNHPVLGWTLIVLGGATIAYNGQNYLALRGKE